MKTSQTSVSCQVLDYCWLLLTAVDCGLLLLTVGYGCCWLLLAIVVVAVVGCWLLLAVVGYCWLLLTVSCC